VHLGDSKVAPSDACLVGDDDDGDVVKFSRWMVFAASGVNFSWAWSPR
jgi:hypothetical protein